MSAGTTWSEPPWSGWIETTGDALLILEAARRGLIPRVTRRLVDAERKMITSGSVFVFDEVESGIKRWTDGFYWSPSRILGNFLLYRETDKRGVSHKTRASDGPDHSLSRPKADNSIMGPDRLRERNLVGSLTNGDKFKPEGLMKKTFSLTIGGVAQHLISYYKVADVENGRLRSPSSLPELASLSISPEYLEKTHFRNPPKLEIGIDGVPRYRGEADDVDLSAGLITDEYNISPEPPPAKRAKSFQPYEKRRDTRKPKQAHAPSSSAQPSQAATNSSPQPSQVTQIQATEAPVAPGYAEKTSDTTTEAQSPYSTYPEYTMQTAAYAHPYSSHTYLAPPPHASTTVYPPATAYSSTQYPASSNAPVQPQHHSLQLPQPSMYYPYYSSYYSLTWPGYQYTSQPPPPQEHATESGTNEESQSLDDKAPT